MSKRLMGYEQITVSSSGQTSATPGDVPGLAVTVECDGSPILIEAKVPFAVGTNNVVGLVSIREGSTQLDLNGMAQSTGLGLLYGPTVPLRARITPSAGVHTYKVSMGSNGSATVQVIATTTSRAFIRVLRDD